VEVEVFIVSAVYWISILAILAWLSKRVSSLKKELASLEKEGKINEN